MDEIGNRTNIAYVQFSNEQDCEKALMRHKQKIRHRFDNLNTCSCSIHVYLIIYVILSRFIEVFRSSRPELLRIMSNDTKKKFGVNNTKQISRLNDQVKDGRKNQTYTRNFGKSNIFEINIKYKFSVLCNRSKFFG